MRPLARFALAVGTVLVTAPAASASDGSLAGVNRASAAASAWSPLTLPSGMAVSRGGYYGQAAGPTPRAGFALSADGDRFVAAELRAVKPSSKGHHPAMFGVSWGGQTDTLATDNILPPGEYQLFLMTDGTNPRLTLNVDGAEGEGSISLDHALPVDRRSTEAVPTAGGTSAIAGNSLTLQRPGMLHVEILLSSAAGPTRAEVCEYVAGEERSGAFGPGCPSARSTRVTTAPDALPAGTCCQKFTAFDFAPGVYGFGGNVVAAAAPAVTVHTVAIPYPDIAGGLAPAPPMPSPPGPVASYRPWVQLKGSGRSRHRPTVSAQCLDETSCEGRVTVGPRTAPGRFTIPSGTTRRLQVPLNARDLRAWRAGRRVRVRVRVHGRDGSGTARSVNGRVVLRGPGRSGRRAARPPAR